MKRSSLITSGVIVVAMLGGCATQSRTQRMLGDSAAVAGGATIAYELSDHNPVVGVAGGIAALGVKTLADRSAENTRSTEIKKAYDQGLAQGLKTKYWDHQADQARDTAATDEGADSDYLPIKIPERSVNGVIVKPTVEYVRVDAVPVGK